MDFQIGFTSHTFFIFADFISHKSNNFLNLLLTIKLPNQGMSYEVRNVIREVGNWGALVTWYSWCKIGQPGPTMSSLAVWKVPAWWGQTGSEEREREPRCSIYKASVIIGKVGPPFLPHFRFDSPTCVDCYWRGAREELHLILANGMLAPSQQHFTRPRQDKSDGRKN